LLIENPDQVLIKSIGLCLIQKITYNAGSGSIKIVKEVVASTRPTQINLDWSGNLGIPLNTKPTQCKHIIEIEYLLKAMVIPEGLPAIHHLKGEVAVKICASKPRELQRNPGRAPSPTLSLMMADLLDVPDDFRAMLGLLPPSYSMLSLTRSLSSETLPPAYDDSWNN
jgi:hypothetical protein